MKIEPTSGRDREIRLIAKIAACVSFLSFLFYFRHGDTLLYGDAVAHINIARRVFDSRTPGLLQLGTVWLPLPHLLMMPFLLSRAAWQSGIGGSVPSMVAYVFGAAGVFRLVRGALSFQSEPDFAARGAAWLAAIIYAANPNLIYLQTTAMTEPLYLAWFIWSVVHFSEFVNEVATGDERRRSLAPASLVKCGWCLAGACLTRYDGWFLAAVLCVAAGWVVRKAKRDGRALRQGFWKFVVLAAAAPTFWLAYNAVIYRNPLEFANGPYSARAIEAKSTATTHPGAHDLRVAFDYFLKSAELNLGEGNWQKVWVGLLLAGSIMIFFFDLRLWVLLPLWSPLPFYVLSVAYGGVPIYLPGWWPFSLYNSRYGLALLPGFAVFTALVVYFGLRLARNKIGKTIVVFSAVILLAGSYASIWRAQPVTLREAWANSRTRIALESELASNLKKLPPGSTLVMYLGDHAGALQRAGIPLRQVINEGNHRTWKRPFDPQGLWESALASPRQYADYVIAIGDDPVAKGVERGELSSVAVIHSAGQPPATIYWTHGEAR